MKRIKKENAVMICIIAVIAALSVFFVVSMKKNEAHVAEPDTVVTEETSSDPAPVTDDAETATDGSFGKKDGSADTPESSVPDTVTDEREAISADAVPIVSDPETSAPDTGSGETKKPETTAKKDSPETRSPEKTAAHDTSASPRAEETEPALSCIISIRCDTVLNNMDRLDAAKIPYVPSDGCILPAVTVEIEDGESVFDVLKYVCDTYGIQLEFSWTPVYNSSYIEGIGYLYEFDCGDESGWIYNVNGTAPNYGCSEYKLHGGENIVWSYSCAGYGADVGAGW